MLISLLHVCHEICLGSVCTQPPYNHNNHYVFLLNPNKALAVSQIKLFTDSRQRDVVLHSFSYRRREHTFFFYESLQIVFPNTVLVSKFHDKCG